MNSARPVEVKEANFYCDRCSATHLALPNLTDQPGSANSREVGLDAVAVR
jgi:hypothetical protein